MRSVPLCCFAVLALLFSGCTAEDDDPQPSLSDVIARRGVPGGGSDDDVGGLTPVKDECADGGCTQICKRGQSCTFACADGSCTQRCEAGATCNFACGGGNCKQECASGSNCTIACGGGLCGQTCSGACNKSCGGGLCR